MEITHRAGFPLDRPRAILRLHKNGILYALPGRRVPDEKMGEAGWFTIEIGIFT